MLKYPSRDSANGKDAADLVETVDVVLDGHPEHFESEVPDVQGVRVFTDDGEESELGAKPHGELAKGGREGGAGTGGDTCWASSHSNGGGCGKETEQASEVAVLEGEVHGSGEVKDCQQKSGQEIGQALLEALQPRTALIHE
jgi:hypothetical protein